MYIITFYSFKGGVGRTLALVNVAAQLTRQGKSVLLVDFDLEAPGLDAFDPLHTPQGSPGLVEFITDYLKTGSSPNAADYVFSPPSNELAEHGKLHVMPSGNRGPGYSARLQAIDWRSLYEEHDGFLLFEDLKAQWESLFHPDYVLVDSRTGHTDICGICTRQLPDAVTLFFLPNEENLRGLEVVVEDVRREVRGPLQKEIELYFVPSNVPNLDDDELILKRRLDEAGRRLHFEQPACIVHRYESLKLLDNIIFSVAHRESRLAKEFARLTDTISSRNLDDRDVALRFLSRESHLRERTPRASGSLDKHLSRIRISHSHDGQVLYALAGFVRRLGREQEADFLRTEAWKEGYRDAELILDRATQFLVEGRREEALSSIHEALEWPGADYFDLSRAVRLILQTDICSLEWFKDAASMLGLAEPEQAWVCEQMLSRRDALPVAEMILRHYHDLAQEAERETNPFKVPLMLCLIGQRKFEEALHFHSAKRPQVDQLEVPDAFNCAIAEWGATRVMPTDLFARVVELSPEVPGDDANRNFCQCLSIANWALGRSESARLYLQHAEQLARIDESEVFSGWRYLLVSSTEFLEDLESQREMLAGASLLPAVIGNAG